MWFWIGTHAEYSSLARQAGRGRKHNIKKPASCRSRAQVKLLLGFVPRNALLAAPFFDEPPEFGRVGIDGREPVLVILDVFLTYRLADRTGGRTIRRTWAAAMWLLVLGMLVLMIAGPATMLASLISRLAG